ncbi:MAG: Nudix family hydrolase [Burkholderiales bacterium]
MSAGNVTLAPRVEVVAAVIWRDHDRFLLAQRPAGKVYAGYWEFPGGKVEAGESAAAALERELHEELGIDVECTYPWITRDYDYEHAAVRLRFYRVTRWRGELHGRENQRFAWQSAENLTVAPLLPANAPIVRALGLPAIYAISNVAGLGEEQYLRRLEQALQNGLRLLQLREKHLPTEARGALALKVVRLAHGYGARVLVNGDAAVAALAGADGLHLTARQLMQTAARPAFDLVGASCHDAAELARAAAIGADFAVLGPVLPTPTHPGMAGMGWEKFAALLKGCPLPVYALGGMQKEHLEAAWRAGAHGVGMLRASLQPID